MASLPFKERFSCSRWSWGRAVREVALAAHEAAHALRLVRGERTAWLASRVMVVRWMLFGSGLTLAFLLNPAAIGVLALAMGRGSW